MSRREKSIAAALQPTPTPSPLLPPPPPPPRRFLLYRQPPYSYGDRKVPLWEMSFYREACGVPFERLRRMQPCRFVKSVTDWDDSAAVEALRNAKARYRDWYHGRPSAISPPDPDAYIDEVDHDAPVELDPEVIEEFERAERDGGGASAGVDPFAELRFEDLEIVPTGWDVETEPDPDPSLLRPVEPQN